MTPALVFLIRSDPAVTHRPVEGLRIALSFAASTPSTCVVLVNRAISLLSASFDDAHDTDTIEQILTAFKDIKTPFYVERKASQAIVFAPDLSIHPAAHEQISDMIAHASCSMVF